MDYYVANSGTLHSICCKRTFGQIDTTEHYTVEAHTDLDNYSDKLRVAMSRLRLCPPRDTPQKDMFQYKELETCSHVFLRLIAIAPPLTAPYAGPYKVISNPKPKSTTSKPAAIARKLRKDRARSSSTNTPKSFRMGVDTNMNTQTQS